MAEKIGTQQVQRRDGKLVNRDVIKCECGQELLLYDSENECECGRLYNLFGQGLRTNYTKAEEMEEFSYGDWNNEGY